MRIFHIIILLASCSTSLASEAGKQSEYTSSEWWLVYLTAALCSATFGLMLYTAKLWRATLKLSLDAEAVAAQQRKDTIRALTATERAALASERSAATAEQSLSASQRAFVFWKGFNSGLNVHGDTVKEYVIFASAENVGLTPALNVRSSINIQFVRGSGNSAPMFKPLPPGPSTVMGPRASIQSAYVPVAIADLVDCWEGRKEIFIWSHLEYQDIFDSSILHDHQQCARLKFIHEPTSVPPAGHPSYLHYELVGEQNNAH